jgi:hypothetical protein
MKAAADFASTVALIFAFFFGALGFVFHRCFCRLKANHNSKEECRTDWPITVRLEFGKMVLN